MTDIPFGNPGQAGDAFEAFTQRDLILSDVPGFFTTDETLAASQDIALYEVVGLSGGQIVPANNTTVTAIGIAAGAIVSGVGETPIIQIIRGGNFNGDMLGWDAAYATDADKIAAFAGADAPTQIVIAFNKYHRA
tara:strand:- start:2833 stop:3237 length:405 start_codon:yes stop_codon:yes gene_type:complete